MNSLNDSLAPQKPSSTLTLTVLGLGHIPGKKNSKMMILPKNGSRPLLITKPAFQKVIKKIVASFVFQLLSGSATGDAATLTAGRRQFLTRLLPQDDCWTQVPQIVLTAELCQPGDEGCTVTIEEIK